MKLLIYSSKVNSSTYILKDKHKRPKRDTKFLMSKAAKKVCKQLYAEGLARLEKLEAHDVDNAYWEDLTEEEALDLVNMIEGYVGIYSTKFHHSKVYKLEQPYLQAYRWRW